MTNALLREVDGQASVAHLPPVSLPAPGTPGRIEPLQIKVIVIEFLAIATICFLTSVVYFEAVLTEWPPTLQYIAAALFIAGLVLIPAIIFRQYTAIHAHSRDRFMWSGVAAVGLAFSLFLSFLFVFKIADWYSRGTFFFQFVGVCLTMLIARSATYGYVRRAINSGTLETRRAVLIGDPRATSDILQNLQQFGIRCAGILRLPDVYGHIVPGIEAYSANTRNFIERCRALNPDDIIFLASPADFSRIAFFADALSELPVAVHVIPTGLGDLWGSPRIFDFGGTAAIQVLRPPLSRVELALKRAFDICAAGVGLILLSPLMAIVSVAIKLDSPGPVLFWQKRHGYNNEFIPVAKFRTMTVMEDGQTATTFTQAKPDDARRTRVGRILRQTNIDELPQLFNILRGEMSVVGPRPHPIALNKMFEERITPLSRRHKVKPGLTGWAQVNGFRGETDTVEKMQRRIEYDIEYIDNWSFLLDLKIIARTIFSKSAYTNAY
jgi:Undecaprenyl-phosphate glucose phosphotransferase